MSLASQDTDYFNKRISKFITIDQGPGDEDDSRLRRPVARHRTPQLPPDRRHDQGHESFLRTHGDPPPESYCSHIAYQSFHQDPRTGDLVWSMGPNVLNGFHEQLVNAPLSYWTAASKITVPWLCVHGEASDTLTDKSSRNWPGRKMLIS